MSDTPPRAPFDYTGPDALLPPLLAALRRVVDPELSLNILDLGLVMAVRLDDERLDVRMTMTSPACPVADLIVDDLYAALDDALPGPRFTEIELAWEPPWTPERMSERARRFMD